MEAHLTPAWLPGLMAEIDAGLNRLTADQHDQLPNLEAELRQIDEKVQGWNASLAKPTLPHAVREAIETQWAEAAARRQEIEALLQELNSAGLRAEELVQPQQVIERLDRLADVLAANDPTRGNLELSLHIDRIICRRDMRVTMRMCKLGVMPDAVELLHESKESDGGPTDEVIAARARRRGKLRVTEDDEEHSLRTQAEFIADTTRFVGLGPEWFWLDEFRIPESSSWTAEHAEAVFRRRQEAKLPYSALAQEFDVTSPTIGAAIRWYLRMHPDERDEVRAPRGGNRKPQVDLSSFADEARALWLDGWSKERLAANYGHSAPTIDKAIAFAYEREGLPMPTRDDMRHDKVAAARRAYDERRRLEDVMSVLKVSSTTARAYLRESFAAEGKKTPDLRRKRN